MSKHLVELAEYHFRWTKTWEVVDTPSNHRQLRHNVLFVSRYLHINIRYPLSLECNQELLKSRLSPSVRSRQASLSRR
jgi:hypothetical protein